MELPSVYIAGAWTRRKELQKLMEEIPKSFSVEVTSHWPDRENGTNIPKHLQTCGKEDFEEIAASDALIAIMTDPEYAYRGTFTEIGYALGLGKKVIIVCPGNTAKKDVGHAEYSHYCQSLVFYWHPEITRVPTIERAVRIVEKYTCDTV